MIPIWWKNCDNQIFLGLIFDAAHYYIDNFEWEKSLDSMSYYALDLDGCSVPRYRTLYVIDILFFTRIISPLLIFPRLTYSAHHNTYHIWRISYVTYSSVKVIAFICTPIMLKACYQLFISKYICAHIHTRAIKMSFNIYTINLRALVAHAPNTFAASLTFGITPFNYSIKHILYIHMVMTKIHRYRTCLR